MIDRKKFFNTIRDSLFSGTFTDSQVVGIDIILDEWERRKYKDLRWLGYALATVYRETGARFEPITESLNYSVEGLISNFGRHRISIAEAQKYGRSSAHPAKQEALGDILYGGSWGRENLGNTEPGDGWKFRGRGFPQLTGRGRYREFGRLLGVDLEKDPEKANEVGLSVAILFEGLVNGKFTGKKLGDYLNETEADWRNARRTINALDRATEIAENAKEFYQALLLAEVAGEAKPKPVEPKPSPGPKPMPLQPKEHWITKLFRAIARLFRRK